MLHIIGYDTAVTFIRYYVLTGGKVTTLLAVGRTPSFASRLESLCGERSKHLKLYIHMGNLFNPLFSFRFVFFFFFRAGIITSLKIL